MLLLHCTMAHSGAWKGVMQRLNDVSVMTAMDLPGHGRSGPRDMSTTWQTQSTEMAIKLLEQTGHPADLVGHSFGATVALRIAVERPDLARSLTLIEPVFFSAAKDAGRIEFDEHMGAHSYFYDLLNRKDYDGAARAFSEIWGGSTAWKELPQKQREYMSDRIEMIRAGGDSVLGTGPDYIPLSDLSSLTVPVLLIEGSDTDAIIGAVQETLADVFPRSKRVVIEGAGHMVAITHAKCIAAEIRDYHQQ